jgi:hypothetical protein
MFYRLRSNGFWGFVSLMRYDDTPTGGCTGGAGYSEVGTMESELTTACTAGTAGTCSTFGGTSAGSNLVVRLFCAGESGCVANAFCSSTDACALAFFTDWSMADQGRTTLFADGWRYDVGATCAIVQSSFDAGVATDIDGDARTPPEYSIGAVEYDGACTP